MHRACLFFILFLSACSHYKPHQHQDGERVNLTYYYAREKVVLGINFLSPDEPGWVETEPQYSHRILLLKENSPASEENQEIESYFVNLDIPFYPVARFIERKKQDIQTYYAKIQELKLQSLDVQVYPGNNKCVRTHVLLEDLRSGKNNQPTRWSEQYALSCIFPVHQGTGYEIRYYHRYYEQNRDNQFASKADALFKSVRVEDRLASWL